MTSAMGEGEGGLKLKEDVLTGNTHARARFLFLMAAVMASNSVVSFFMGSTTVFWES